MKLLVLELHKSIVEFEKICFVRIFVCLKIVLSGGEETRVWTAGTDGQLAAIPQNGKRKNRKMKSKSFRHFLPSCTMLVQRGRCLTLTLMLIGHFLERKNRVGLTLKSDTEQAPSRQRMRSWLIPRTAPRFALCPLLVLPDLKEGDNPRNNLGQHLDSHTHTSFIDSTGIPLIQIG